MKILKAREKDILIIELKGRLDAESSKNIYDEFLGLFKSTDKKFIIECTDLEFLSSAGIRLFYIIGKDSLKNQTKIFFSNPNENIRKVFELVDFYSDFPVYKDMNEAISVMNLE